MLMAVFSMVLVDHVCIVTPKVLAACTELVCGLVSAEHASGAVTWCG